MEQVFAVDPGSRKGHATCGVAHLDPEKVNGMLAGQPCGELVRAWTIDGTSVAAVAGVMQVVKGAGGRLVIERQFPSIRSGANPLDLEKVIATRVVFTTLATVMRVPFEEVYPASWQALLRACVPLTSATGKMSKKMKRMIHDTKRSAAWLVAQLYPDASLGQHEADAALMGRWSIERRLACASVQA